MELPQSHESPQINPDSDDDSKLGSNERIGYQTSPHAPNIPENNVCKLIDYRGVKVASFTVNGRELMCLPQAFELFLKHLVGGLHTVYTKLKRLEVIPVVCNVEQVRILRGLSAIQPGVNRCKLISPAEFDTLYEDCTSSSARPGRPPKRSGYIQEAQDSPSKLLRKAMYPFDDMKRLSPPSSLVPPSLFPAAHYQGFPGMLGNPFMNTYPLNQLMQQAALQMSLTNQIQSPLRAPLVPSLMEGKRSSVIPCDSTNIPTDLHNFNTNGLTRLHPPRSPETQQLGRDVKLHCNSAFSPRMDNRTVNPSSQQDARSETLLRRHSTTEALTEPTANQISASNSPHSRASTHSDLNVVSDDKVEENRDLDEMLLNMKNNINTFIISIQNHQQKIIEDIERFRASLQLSTKPQSDALQHMLRGTALLHSEMLASGERREQIERLIDLARSDMAVMRHPAWLTAAKQ